MNPFTTVEDLIIDPSFRRWILHRDPEARAQWQAYLAAHPEKKVLVEKARIFLQELPVVNYRMSGQEMEDLWNRIEGNAGAPAEVVPIQKKQKKLRWYYAVASIVALLSLIYFWKPTTATRDFTSTYQTNYGQTREIMLPDGSVVTLNANSSLHFNSQTFNSGARNVWMQGEAFFEIAKVAAKDKNPLKFIVHTDNLEVEVLGTQFNVNTRRTATKVVLTEGKVRLNLAQTEKKQPVNMMPGEMVIYNPAQKILKRENVNLNVYTAWKQQELVFEDTPVSEIIDLLEDNYGLKINLQNKKAGQRRYTGTFKNPDPDIILMAVTALFDLKMERNDHEITLKQ